MRPKVLECDQLPILTLCWEEQEKGKKIKIQKYEFILSGHLLSLVSFTFLLFSVAVVLIFDLRVVQKTT